MIELSNLRGPWTYTHGGTLARVEQKEFRRLEKGVQLTASGKGFSADFANALFSDVKDVVARKKEIANWQQAMNKKLKDPNPAAYKGEWLLRLNGSSAAMLGASSLKALQHAFLDYAKHFQFDEVRKLVEQDNAYVNCQPDGRWTALHQACLKGDEDMVQFLLDNGADVSLKNPEGETPKEVAKAALEDKTKESRHGEYRACVTRLDLKNVDVRLREAGCSMDKLRAAIDLVLCTEDQEVLAPKDLRRLLEKNLGLESGELDAFKEGIKAEIKASYHRVMPSTPASVLQLEKDLKELERAEEDDWSAVLSMLIKMHKYIVRVPMLKQALKLMDYLSKKGNDLAKLSPDDDSWTKEQRNAHKCARHLHALWKKHYKKAPSKCERPELVEATDDALILSLKLPKAGETEITAMVVTFKPTAAHESHKPKAFKVRPSHFLLGSVC